MRQRALTAVVLVLVLLLVLWLGGVVLAAAIALVTVIAARERARLLTGSGHATFPWPGMALALDDHPGRGLLPGVLEGSGLLLVAVGIVLVLEAAFSKPDPRDGLDELIATVFGALYVSLLAFVLRLAIGPGHPERRPAGLRRCRDRRDPAAGPRGLVL